MQWCYLHYNWFEETKYKLKCDIHIQDYVFGIIEVFCKLKNDTGNEDPFLDEEKDLISNVAIILSETISKHQVQERLFNLNRELEMRVDKRTRDLKKTTSRLELATKAGGIGVWEWDAETEKVNMG